MLRQHEDGESRKSHHQLTKSHIAPTHIDFCGVHSTGHHALNRCIKEGWGFIGVSTTRRPKQHSDQNGCANIVDELDERILEAMSNGIGVGPRLTELAKHVGVPRSTANLRVRMLTEKHIVTGYRPEINWEELGYYINGYMGVECPKSVVGDLIIFLENQEWVFGIWEVTTGKYGLLVMCRFQQYSEIEQVQTFTKTVQGVRDADVFLLGKYHKLK